MRFATTVMMLVAIAVTLTAGESRTLDLSTPYRWEVEYNAQGYWTQTYSTATRYRHIVFGENGTFSLTHCVSGYGGDDVGGGMSYWDGFTLSRNCDTSDHGSAGTGGSQGWVANQWGCMAGGGIKRDENGNAVTDGDGSAVVDPAQPYSVAYWGYWQEWKEGGVPACQIDFKGAELFKPQGVWVCNHPWPYYGNIHGDGFARPFNREGDSFKLYIHGLDADGNDIGSTVQYTLAETRLDPITGSYQLHQNPTWQWIDLTPLGAVTGIYFTMSSTDSDPVYGMNTACYFCIDALKVMEMTGDDFTAPGRPGNLKAIPTETTLDLSWTASIGDIAGYIVAVDGDDVAMTRSLAYVVEDLEPWTEHTVAVRALGYNEEESDPIQITARTADEHEPGAPSWIEATATTSYSIDVSWGEATDNVGVTDYHLYLDGKRMKRVTSSPLSHTLTGLEPNTKYLVEVEARDGAGNRSERASVTVTTPANSGVAEIEADYSGKIRYYDLQGRPLKRPSSPGVYLKRRGAKVEKITVK